MGSPVHGPYSFLGPQKVMVDPMQLLIKNTAGSLQKGAQPTNTLVQASATANSDVLFFGARSLLSQMNADIIAKSSAHFPGDTPATLAVVLRKCRPNAAVPVPLHAKAATTPHNGTLCASGAYFVTHHHDMLASSQSNQATLPSAYFVTHPHDQ